jgi:hypothetical protein
MATQIPSASPFFKGWRRLPDELKVHVLKYALPADQNFGDCGFFRTGKNILGPPLMVSFHKVVFPLLIAFPESPGLISEVFYSTNTMVIHDTCPSEISELQHPPQTVTYWVHQVQINLKLSVENLHYLRRLSRGEMGLPNLQLLAIQFMGYECPILARERNVYFNFANEHAVEIEELRQFLEDMAVIEFNAKELEVVYRHARHPKITGWNVVVVRDPWEERLLEKMCITGSSQGDEKWERYYENFRVKDGKPRKEPVEEWPMAAEISDAKRGIRTTVKKTTMEDGP